MPTFALLQTAGRLHPILPGGGHPASVMSPPAAGMGLGPPPDLLAGGIVGPPPFARAPDGLMGWIEQSPVAAALPPSIWLLILAVLVGWAAAVALPILTRRVGVGRGDVALGLVVACLAFVALDARSGPPGEAGSAQAPVVAHHSGS